ncbi:hypothetical protein AVEN_259042-1 [Araneus ventricosus]|uniref:Integrase catalytic domain-containing protein n=1 Tax=Araneus ventricosus TaxID=182803 RepID=A0A4Y2WJ36_ARAVE|nr:hypothetical protein AVEN_259042-1 [Araneus ventricosus]
MGDLPEDRVNPNFVFTSVGIDFAGPFYIKTKLRKRDPPTKIYVCIIICLSTKAIHLELVSDLSSEALIAALKRFMARRGKCRKILSANATNFVGTKNEINRLFKLMEQQDALFQNFLSEEEITWSHIPPKAPHHGGLWEASVKSFKFYFKRVVSNTCLTYEEFLTILFQIEGLLNSRPLTPLSSEGEDLEILTPGHFLIGRPITSIPEPLMIELNDNRLNRWQLLTKKVQAIWKHWSKNYLNNLQQRHKWMFKKDNFKIGDMVLIKEDNVPVSNWPLGRVVKLYPGKDNIIRVVDIKTKTGIFKRSVSRLCVLPIERHCNFQIAKYPTRANALQPSRLTHGGTKFLRLRLLLPPQGEVKRRKNFGDNGAGELIEAGMFLQDAAELTKNDPDLNCVAIS